MTIEDPPRFLLRWPKYPWFDRAVVCVHARRLLASLGDEQSPLLALVFHPAFVEYCSYLRADVIAYHAYDLFEATPGWNDWMEAKEVALLKRADIVTAVSEPIAARLRQKVAREVRVLPNGVDLEAFGDLDRSPRSEPLALARIAHPRLGYVGSLHPQVDYGLVATLARSRPRWNFVFVGARVSTVDPRAAQELAACERCPNVHFLGEMNRLEVPAYILNMDVNLMIYRVTENTWIKAIYPLKLHEYLAAGKPIVSADVPSVRDFASVVRIATSEDDWRRAIEDALQFGGPGSESQRRAVASENTWDARVARLDEWFGALARAKEQP